MSELLFGLLFAHFCADFLLQTNKINTNKNSLNRQVRIRALLTHSSIHFVCYFVIYSIIFFFYKNPSFNIFFTSALISFIHYWVDLAKVHLSKGTRSTLFKVIAYVIDQVLHVIVITVILQFITHEIHYTDGNLTLFLKSLFSTNSDQVLFSLKDKLFLLGAIVIITTHFYGYLIEMVLTNFKPKGKFNEEKIETKKTTETDLTSGNVIDKQVIENTSTTLEYKDDPSAPESVGKYIGMLERLVILILMISKSISAIGFLIALKGLSRFKQFDNKSFAEYSLVGTLLSILFGFISSYFATRIWNL